MACTSVVRRVYRSPRSLHERKFLVHRETGKEEAMELHYDEGVATLIGPESCVVQSLGAVRSVDRGAHRPGFFDSVSQEWPVHFLEHRIGDKRISSLGTAGDEQYIKPKSRPPAFRGQFAFG